MELMEWQNADDLFEDSPKKCNTAIYDAGMLFCLPYCIFAIITVIQFMRGAI